jgi:hypothetical protein
MANMEFIREHPKKSKWKVYAYRDREYGEPDPNYIRHIYMEPDERKPFRRYDTGEMENPNLVWERHNFIFRATMQMDVIGSSIWMNDMEEPEYRYRFVYSTINNLLKLIHHNKIGTMPGFIVQGLFTFRKQGSEIFVEAYVE